MCACVRVRVGGRCCGRVFVTTAVAYVIWKVAAEVGASEKIHDDETACKPWEKNSEEVSSIRVSPCVDVLTSVIRRDSL